MAVKQIIIGECVYTVDIFYRAGQQAFQNGISYHFNPYRSFSKRWDQWNYGHCNEADDYMERHYGNDGSN